MVKIAMSLAVLFLVGASAGLPTPAAAQAPGATMLIPGVYTTPEISSRCQQYTAQRVPVGGDQQRQSVFIACVKKAYAEQFKSAPVKGQ